MDTKVLQLQKRASYEFQNIQDKYAISADTRTYALADGTTQSFNSEIWAEIITKGFVNNPTFNANDLIHYFTTKVVEYKNTNFKFSDNPAKASLERTKLNKGATATFIGVQYTSENKIKIITCGDTNLFLLNSENNIIAFPFSQIEALDANNYFINTEQLIENKIDESFFKQKSIDFKSTDKIIIATDALSRFILNQPSKIHELLKIEDFNQLKDFCLHYWESKELQEDDISAIIISAQNIGIVKEIIPPIGFSFPKEEEVEFIPKSLQQNNFTDMEMKEIKNNFNAVAQDFHQVKTRLKNQEMLLMIVISLLTLNILLIYFSRPANSNNKTNKIDVNYESTIFSILKTDIQGLKTEFSELKKETKKEKTTTENTNYKEESPERKKEIKKAGYNAAVDSPRDEKTQKNPGENLQKKKDMK
jgi:hypothetical protein